MTQTREPQRRALAWVALGALLAVAWVAYPVATGLFLGALMGFTVQPIYEALSRRTGRPVLASLATVLAAALIIVSAVVGFVSLFFTRAVALANAVRDGLGPGGPVTAWVETATRWLDRAGVPADRLTDRLREGATDLASRSASLAATVASSTFLGLLNLFFALLTMDLILRHWPRMASTLEIVLPLRPEYTRALLDEFRLVGRTTLFGTVATGLAQGALAAVGYGPPACPRRSSSAPPRRSRRWCPPWARSWSGSPPASTSWRRAIRRWRSRSCSGARSSWSGSATT